MLVLGADTSLTTLSVALVRDDTTLGVIALEGKGSRNEKLLPAIDFLMTECGVTRDEVDLFATTRGPGSFTGVRVGLATIQGLALALRKPVAAMSTYEAVAFAIPPAPSTLVYDDAGRGEFYYGTFVLGETAVEPRLASRAELDEAIASAARVIAIPEFVRERNTALRAAGRALELHARATLAAYRDATPIYVRLAEAEVKLNQQRNG